MKGFDALCGLGDIYEFRSKKVHARILVLIAVLALAALACSSISGIGGKKTDSGGDILFQDDFSDPNSGWGRQNAENGITDYADGGYRIYVNVENWYFWSNPGKEYGDVIIDVDAKKLGGPDDNDFGVICRYKDEENFYYILISSDGYYGAAKYSNGEEALVGMEEFGYNDRLINPGAATNHLKASCVGSSISLEVNGTELFTVHDTDIASGDVGLIAGTYDTVGTDILFDNFVVRKP